MNLSDRINDAFGGMLIGLIFGPVLVAIELIPDLFFSSPNEASDGSSFLGTFALFLAGSIAGGLIGFFIRMFPDKIWVKFLVFVFAGVTAGLAFWYVTDQPGAAVLRSALGGGVILVILFFVGLFESGEQDNWKFPK